jgi:hypothetical protein
MNLRKHLAGLALFSAILGTAIFINYYLTLPDPTIPPVQVFTPGLKVSAEDRPQLIDYDYKVRQVSLDFINGESYATLTFKHEAGDPAPDWLWVTTIFLSPESEPAKIWVTKTQIHNPFGAGAGLNLPGTYEVTATAPCPWCDLPGRPAGGYFARVYVSADINQFPSAETLDPDIRAAVPVLVQAKREPRR